MEITHALRELARFSAGTLPVISVYLNTQWRDQHQRERAATFLTRHLRQARLLSVDDESARASLQADLARLADWGGRLLRGTVEIAMPGYALFACDGAELWIELPAPVPFEDEFTIADYPTLRQLARLDEDYSNALVVLVDSRAARVCEVVLGGLLSETAFASEVPGRHKQGGWAQMRYQRHVKDHMDRHHKEVAAYLTAHPQTQLILSGQEAIVSNLRSFLPPPVQAQLLDTVRLDIREAPNRIVEAAQDVLQRHEREEEQANLQLLLNRAGHGGLAVVGMQETLAAVNWDDRRCEGGLAKMARSRRRPRKRPKGRVRIRAAHGGARARRGGLHQGQCIVHVPEEGFLVNLAGDYRYMTGGYYCSQDMEAVETACHPTCQEALDAYIAPLFLAKVRLAKLPVPEYYITDAFFEPPVLAAGHDADCR